MSSAWVRSPSARTVRAPKVLPISAATAVAAGAAGALVALFISHRRGIYYAFMTIAFGQIFWTLSIKSHGVTGGEDGLLKIRRLPADFGMVSFDLTDNVAFYYFVLAVFAVGVVVLWRLVHSPYGRVIAAIKQSEVRAAHLGYNVWLYKASVFTLSAALSGLAGGLFAMAQLAAFPDVMSLHQSGYVVMMTLVGGGLVSFWGPVIGVSLFLTARDVIGALTNAWMRRLKPAHGTTGGVHWPIRTRSSSSAVDGDPPNRATFSISEIQPPKRSSAPSPMLARPTSTRRWRPPPRVTGSGAMSRPSSAAASCAGQPRSCASAMTRSHRC
ncbi:membrane hypothetical protein [Bradyrhizobium sp. ORS 375]|nr:membrane hypothetical protein [Bradyrhizobium sp. ORS 375]